MNERAQEIEDGTTETNLLVFRWKCGREGSRKRRRNDQIEEGTIGKNLRASECMQRFFPFSYEINCRKTLW